MARKEELLSQSLPVHRCCLFLLGKEIPNDSGNTAYFVTQLRVDGALNHSGERFQNDAVSVSGFTGFIRAEGRFA